ncbi:hypothetical protein ACKVMT_08540 [Halobacteriales archaeon Cl-PHB]
MPTSPPSDRRLAVAAILVVVVGLVATWQVAAVRESQARQAEVRDLVNDTVDSRQAPNDYDGDGVGDASDACPTRSETTNGFQDGDGCPDVVATTGAS